MPEVPGFAPPEPTPPPQHAAWAPPAVPPAYQYPQPKKTPRWVLPVVVGSAVLVIGGIVAGAVAVVNALPDIVSSGGELFGPNPLATGEPQSPTAADPLECETQCFTPDSVVDTIVPQSRLDELGLTTVAEEWGDYAATDADWEYSYLKSEWRRLGSDADSCFFTLPQFAFAAELATSPGEGDYVDFTGTSTSDDEFSRLSQSVRFFATSAEAEQHMTRLNELIADCDYYAYDPDVEDWRATVSPAPALDVPDNVAAVGWREVYALSRYYVFDLQHANMVVRVVVATSDVISEADYRELVEELAAHLAKMELPQGLT